MLALIRRQKKQPNTTASRDGLVKTTAALLLMADRFSGPSPARQLHQRLNAQCDYQADHNTNEGFPEITTDDFA